jgi:hypothetical protein
MAVIEGKTPAERNKMIVAVVLGAIALISLAYMLLGSSSKSTTTSSKTPKPSPASASNRPLALTPGKVPDEGFIPTVLNPDISIPPVPEAGRNIFAFYVAPKPTPNPNANIPPTPIPPPTPKPANLLLASISPVNVYAHTSDFTLDVTGDKFTPDTHIFIGGAELQTRFVSPQQLSTKVPAQLISFEGRRDVMVRSRDGQLFSNNATLNVMPAPVPNYTVIGLTLRPGSNDTAILKEKNGKELMTVQRGDLLGGRFRVTSISKSEVTVIDSALKIKHTLPLVGDSSNPGNPGQPRYTPPPQPPADDNDPEP